jgi:thiol-disulfide isomerase/thioredoxin
MVISRSDTAPVRPCVNAPTRREIVLSGLLGTVASLASPAIASPQAVDIPTFESGRYQFTIIRPQRELPSIRLFRLEGGTIDLSSLRGKPILLNFWASWCAACRTELPILERQCRSAWQNNLHVVAVSEDRSSRQAVERFVTVDSIGICGSAVGRSNQGRGQRTVPAKNNFAALLEA